MVGTDKKTLLIVEDDSRVLEMYEMELGKRYNVTSVFYTGEKTKIPLEKFDRAILDGLNGDCISVAGEINAEKKIVISGDCNLLQKVREKGLIAGEKPLAYDKLEEMLR